MKSARTLLTTLGAILLTFVALIAALVVSRSSVDAKTNDWVGSWNTEVLIPNLNVMFPALMTFNSDGNLIADETPSPLETSGHGAWIKTGGNEGAYTFYYLVGDAADPAKWTRGKVSGSIKLSPQADKWSGPFKIIVLDQNGNTTFSADGKMSATRINVEH